MGKKTWRCSILCLCAGILTFVAGIVMIPLLRIYINNMIAKEVTLEEGTFVYDAWKEPPFPIYFEFYFFDVLNPEEVSTLNKKIEVKQRGPYTYSLTSIKNNITFNANGTVSYREPYTYVFDRSRSVGPESDTFTTVNVILLTMFNTIRYEYEFIKVMTELLADSVNDNKLFIRLSVHDIIWGYEDTILLKVKEELKELGIPFDDHFGFFYKLNNTDDGLWTIDSGKRDSANNFDIRFWNGKSMLDFWSTEESNMINGTDGNLFHPFVKKTDHPPFFFSELCRSMTVDFQRDSTVQGIDTYRFTHPRDIFDNPDQNPANDGFCTPLNNCPPSGLYNISVCRKGSPFSVSMPHFLYGDDRLINAIEGMKPDASLHETFIDIMHDIGCVLRTERKYQINMLVRNNPSFEIVKDIEDVYFPVFWFNESTIVTDDWADFIRSSYLTPVHIASYIPYISIAVGVVVTFTSSIAIHRQRKKSKDKMQENQDGTPSERTSLLINDDDSQSERTKPLVIQ
ncbi:lysosome membrane protein 2-like [Ylistrum balloti]|uniref:lysosome membrane protein 2-like n=1 Tax=Ylistrum balloti TaxID=509963 RepID=UPI002905D005|nr:lysosome membrane protein 2-like [Ylistrum balloti]